MGNLPFNTTNGTESKESYFQQYLQQLLSWGLFKFIHAKEHMISYIFLYLLDISTNLQSLQTKSTYTIPFHFLHFVHCNNSVLNNKFALLWGEAQLCLPYVCL